ncbi:LemA family protein [Oceanirhabdus sp. W0125-5]|uniref:LemA family protein n=1 Tax=Oceanirhabdus sp. W0125-5 TaxID=2999116 RepID=UPI0022F2D159|nr:LemA family protein [Oceanirhabdus sp. W0125-5]WBW97405.1 LemA family protein [Oceanirhabdus sp. W0125-5]
MKKLVVGMVAFVAVLLVYSVMTYNGLVSVNEDVHNKWAQVENNYQRRADLIPNLVNTVKGYAEHESGLLTEITNLRSGYKNADSLKEFDEVDAKLNTMLKLTVESYPSLKANENFMKLQDELAGTENRVAIARKDYNDSVTKYNKKIKRFPTNMFANIFGFDKVEFYTASPGAEKAPNVEF